MEEPLLQILLTLLLVKQFFCYSLSIVPRPVDYFYRSRISSVGRALDCRAGGRGLDFRGRTNTQDHKMIEK